MSIQNDKLMNLADGKVLYDDLRTRIERKFDDPGEGESGQFLQINSNGDAVWGESASPTEVVNAVEDWLDENVSGGETLIADSSFSIEGAAADAKAVGDALEHYATDVDYDETTQTLHLVNADGEEIGDGTTIETGISGIRMYTETDDTDTQYLVLADGEGNELARTEFNVTGGGSGSSYTCRFINRMDSARLSYPMGQSAVLDYSYTEYFGIDQTSANAVLEVYTKTATTDYELVKTENIAQGQNSLDVTNYLESGTNYIKLQVTGGESGTVKVFVYTITLVDMTLTSSFDATHAYDSTISFMYRVTGRNISKVMHFTIDGSNEWTVDIGTAHNVQLTETINLASYGHGDHVLRCWFVAGDGGISPALTYDIIFDTGASTPIISSTFDMTNVVYGNIIPVEYVVYTHGSDYTASVDLEIYTMEDDEPVYYSQQTLSDVVNEQVRQWYITDYPESGTIYLKISAGSASKIFTVEVAPESGDRDLSGVTTRLIAAYTASGRSNSDVNRENMNAIYTSVDDISTTIPGTLTGFNWRSNGWMSDSAGYPVLRISGGAEVNLNLPFFAGSWTDASSHTINLAGTPTAVGRTFEVSFATSGVTDEDEEIITLWDDVTGIGVKVFPSRAYLLSGTMGITRDSDGNILNKNAIPYVPYGSSGKVRLSFVIEEVGHYVETGDNNQNKQLIKIYVNGQAAKALAYTNDDFTTSAAKPRMTAEKCVLDIYTMRFYDYAMSDADVLKNYIADLPAISDRIAVYDRNDILDDGGDINLDLARKQYPCMVLTGALSQYKGDKVKIGVLLYHPDSSDPEEYTTVWEFMDTDGNAQYGNVNNVQGTSSQYYIKKNYKITFYRWNESQNKFAKVKVEIMPGLIPVNTICIKADYMSPDSANTGNSNYWQSILDEPTPPQAEDARVQTSVMGYPMLVFQRNDIGQTPEFIGRYNLNNDKSNSEAFGLEDDGDSGNETKCQKWEYLDNSEDICNFLTDELRATRTDSENNPYEAWEDALESCYPDQGDLEDDGLAPKLDYIQTMYTWVVQRANFLSASTSTGGGTYNGVTYTNDYGLKFAIFRREFPMHFNVHHTLHYFIANEVALLVDNLAKNLFMTTYDTGAEHLVDGNGDDVSIGSLITDGAVDAGGIDWENSTFAIWYPTLYDLDSCLGADNNGFDQFPYSKEMWDTYNNGYVVNGHNSLFWRLVYAAYYNELKALYCTFRDTNRTLTPDSYLRAMIDDLTERLPIVSVNKDEEFKYINAYEGGYYDQSANNGQGGWLYTQSYLYLVKSTMASYHRDFITKRFAMLDSKYLSDAYMQDRVTLRINRGQSDPNDLAFNITPFQAMYCYTEWGNSGTYIGGKALEGESVEMKPASSGNWFDIVLAIYGASHIRSFGDLSVLVPSKLQNFSLCTSLTELIIGSSESGYENSALDSLADVSYLTMLQKLNICNCTALSGTIDLSNCDLIEEVYATGSSIGSVTLPQGGYLKKLYLPGTVTTLNVIGHSGLTHFGMDSYGSLTRLRVENTPNIDTAAILAARGSSLQRIRLVGVDWTLTDDDVLWTLADPSMAGKAIDANGNNVADGTVYPTVTGTVYVNHIYEELYDTLAELYPNLTVTYGTFYHFVKFYNEGVLHETQKVDDGTSGTAPAAPTKAPTTQYAYVFSSWDTTYTNVTTDLNINATFTSITQQYTVKFWEDNTKQTLLETHTVQYDTTETLETAPTRTGYVLCGWENDGGYVIEHANYKVNGFAALSGNGTPVAEDFYPVWDQVKMSSTSKGFSELAPGEMLFAAIAIQRGSMEGYNINHDSQTNSYSIQETSTGNTITIFLADEKDWTLSDGQHITQRVLDFNHDYSDEAETQPIGITYDIKNLITPSRTYGAPSRAFRPYSIQIGNDDPILSENEAIYPTPNTLANVTHSHTATADEVSAGYVNITALGPSFINKIYVTHSDQSVTTWYFGIEGYYFWSDVSRPTQWSDGTSVGNHFNNYISDIDIGPNQFKIGKILYSLGCTVKDWIGNVAANGLAQKVISPRILLTDTNVTLNDFGGIRIDTTASDDDNTAAKNHFDGNGKSRIRYCPNWSYSDRSTTVISKGTVIGIPVTSGDTVTIVSILNSFTYGGYKNSDISKWIDNDVVQMLPFSLRSTIIPAYKKSNIGDLGYTVLGFPYTLWMLGDAELGGNTHYKQYSPGVDCGTKYPVFTNGDSRKKGLYGETIVNGETYFIRDVAPTDQTVVATYARGVNDASVTANWPGSTKYTNIGFCSGEVPAST